MSNSGWPGCTSSLLRMCTASTLPATSAATGTTKAWMRACEVLGVRRPPTKYSTRLATMSTAMTRAPTRAPRPAGAGAGSVASGRRRRHGGRVGRDGRILAHGSWLVLDGRNSAEGGGNGACNNPFQSLRSPIVVCVASSSTGRERPACQPPPIAL